ncbi:Ankyrin repeat-containing protein [Litoreibacter ascidiaceicola]|uniref:Ankyrin repeat-containing protein n=1 Tax=Litoreibacter ascidiaceicola TaxID=1486859 RepID=A0A1M5D443_9RHOB|nr:ankyrin repeat domain-containing protein [Litoreibacter ascidiaceicola]SHF61809.1 Ankyrin repeat-containing protein [Litoreibacter ascidiaceicola]
MTYTHSQLYEFAKKGDLPRFFKHFLKPDEEGWIAVHYAAMHGDLHALERLSAWGLDALFLAPDRLDAFEIALDHGHFAVCDWLLSIGASLEPRPNDYSALDYAAMQGNLEAVSYLLSKGALIDGVVGNRPPIVWAAQERQLEVFEALLKQGASASKSGGDLDHMTALLMSASEGKMEFLEAIFRIGPTIEVSHLIAAAELAEAFGELNAERLIRSKV